VTAPAPSSTEARPEDTWVVTAIDASGEGLRAPRGDGSLTVSWLPAGRLEGETACGTYVGGYTIEGDRIRMGVLSPGIEPCGRREEDEAFALTQALGLVTTWAAEPAGLALLDDAGSTRITLVSPDAAAAALAGDWRVRALAGRSGALIAPIEGNEVTILFGEGGQATGNTGCRDFEAGYSIEADRIVIAPISAIGLPCEGEQRRQDGRLLSLLGEAFEWRRERERLVLVGADGDVLLEAVALSSPPGSSPTVPPDAPAASATSSPAFALPSSAPDV
jgi:heat shock protein HslJ